MSTVRMCDFETENGPCGIIFSERDTGWSTGTMTVIDDDGKPTTERADFCPDHSPRARRRNGTMPRLKALSPAQAPGAAAAPYGTTPDPKDWTDPRNAGTTADLTHTHTRMQGPRQYDPTTPTLDDTI